MDPGPIPNGESNVIGGWWTDLKLCSGDEAVYYQTIPAAGGVPQHLVIEYNNVEYYDCDTDYSVTFEIKLFPDGTIQVEYNNVADVPTGGYDIAVGIENATGTTGASYCYQSAFTGGATASKSSEKQTAATPHPAVVTSCGAPYHTAIQFSGYTLSLLQHVLVAPINNTQRYQVALAGRSAQSQSLHRRARHRQSHLEHHPDVSGCSVVSSPNPTNSPYTPGYCRFVITSATLSGCSTGSSKGANETVTGTYYRAFSTTPHDITFVMMAEPAGCIPPGRSRHPRRTTNSTPALSTPTSRSPANRHAISHCTRRRPRMGTPPSHRGVCQSSVSGKLLTALSIASYDRSMSPTARSSSNSRSLSNCRWRRAASSSRTTRPCSSSLRVMSRACVERRTRSTRRLRSRAPTARVTVGGLTSRRAAMPEIFISGSSATMERIANCVAVRPCSVCPGRKSRAHHLVTT